MSAPVAMVLAAGLGKRMLPLTEHTPKPLLKVAGKPLIEHTLGRLAGAGVGKVVINLAHLGRQIEEYLGDGSRFGLEIHYSREGVPLETAGGIMRALPMLGDAPFFVVNSDVWCDFDFSEWARRPLPNGCPGRLLMVNNPPFNPEGDFGIERGLLSGTAQPRFTFSGISFLRPQAIAEYPRARASFGLAEVFAHEEGRMQAELFNGDWCDVGTPERLAALDARLRQDSVE